ncbi:MAG TPA: PIN domain-containing protein [Thermoanaerobaculia bacterium]|nr:PIN domain-containing protein [Thermoanaerobaculia bacterium]
MPSVLVDTDTLYQFLVGSEGLSPGAVQLIEKAIETGDLFISVVTVIQLKDLNARKRLTDADLSKLEKVLIAFPSRIQVLPLDYQTALHFESVLDNSKFAERAVVATAHLHGMTLVTTNAGLRGNPAIDTLWAGEPRLVVAGVRSK